MLFLFGKQLKYFLELNKTLERENNILEAEVNTLKEIIEYERLERTKLQDAILTRTGFISNENIISTDTSNLQPLGKTRWPQLRRKLEMDARDKSNKGNHKPEDVEKLINDVTELIDKGEQKE